MIINSLNMIIPIKRMRRSNKRAIEFQKNNWTIIRRINMIRMEIKILYSFLTPPLKLNTRLNKNVIIKVVIKRGIIGIMADKFIDM
jgi:hypothetical protein